MRVARNTAYKVYPAEKQAKKAKIIKMPKVQPDNRQKKAEYRLKLVAIVCAVALLVVTLLPGLCLRLMMTEVSNQIDHVNSLISEETGTRTQLEMKLAAMMSLDNIEEYVESLGMVKADSDQIEYIKINDEDKIIKD